MANLDDFRSFVVSKYPNISKAQLNQLDDFVSQQKAVENVKSGVQTIDQIPDAQKQAVAYMLNQQGVDANKLAATSKEKATQAATVEKNAPASNAATNFINELESSYQSAGGGNESIGPLARIEGKAKSIESAIGLNDNAKTYENSKTGFAATLKSLTGDTGVLTDQDYARLSKLLPELGATPGEAKKSFDILRSQIAAKYGQKPTETTVNNNGGSLMDKVINNVVGNPVKNIKNFAQDVGAGAGQMVVQPHLNQKLQQAQDILNQANKETDPAKKQALLDQAKGMFQTNSQQAQKLSTMYSPDVNQNPITRGLRVGLDAATLAELPGASTAVKDLLTKGGSSVADIAANKLSAKTISAARDAVAEKLGTQGVSFSGKELAQAAKDYVSKDPLAKNIADKLIPALTKKTLSPKQLVDQMQLWNKAYTAAGSVGKSEKAGIYNAIGSKAREMIAKDAPELAAKNKDFARYFTGKKVIGTAGRMVANGAVQAAVYKLLGFGL